MTMVMSSILFCCLDLRYPEPNSNLSSVLDTGERGLRQCTANILCLLISSEFALKMASKSLKDLGIELTKITKELNKTRDKKNGPIGVKELEDKGLINILDGLAKGVELVRSMLEKGEDNCPKVKILEEKTRVLEDQSDHHHQRSLKGKFMISSLKTNNVIVSEEQFKKGSKTLVEYVTELIFQKLGVRVKPDEIISCHFTSSGLIIFRMGDFKPGSSYDSIVTAIKSGQGKDVKDLFINFALTPRRASLLYEVRQLVKAKKISKFVTYSDGSISVVKLDGKTKVKVTNYTEKEGGAGGQGGGADGARTGKRLLFSTMTCEELKDRFGGQV